MSDLLRQNSRKPATLTTTQSSETRSDQDVSSTGPDSPGRRRRASIDRPGQVSRRSNAPDAETNALLRDRFLHHLVTQVKLSSVVRKRALLVLASPVGAERRPRLPPQTPFLLLLRSADTHTLSGARQTGRRVRIGDSTD